MNGFTLGQSLERFPGFFHTAHVGQCGGLESAGSFGWAGGFNSVFWVDPAEDLIGVVMSQRLMDMGFLNGFRTLAYQAIVV